MEQNTDNKATEIREINTVLSMNFDKRIKL